MIPVRFVLVLVAYNINYIASEAFRDPSRWTDCYASENVVNTVYTRSLILCAMRCHTHRCAVFNQSGDACELFLDGSSEPALASSFVSTHLYRGLLPASALTSKEVAHGRPVTGSQHYMECVPDHVTDGNLTNFYHSIDDDTVLNPYLLVDLQGLRVVEKIRVLPYAGSFSIRFINVQIWSGNAPTTGNFSEYTLVATIDGPIAFDQGWMEFDVTPPRCSRYVTLYKYVTVDWPYYLLEVHEIEVIARSH